VAVQVSTNQLRTPDWVIWLAALAGPMVVTVVLLGYSNAIRRDYVFIYLGLVAVVGVLRGRRRRPRNLFRPREGRLGAYAALADQVGGEFIRLKGSNVAATLAAYIRDSQATEVVLGHRRRARWRPMDTTSELIRRLAGVDVHILRARDSDGDRANQPSG
jgi:K+-sensing histidine kinase KdpD